MTRDKGEERENKQGIGPPDSQTLFERFYEFAKRLVAVPKPELEKQERVYQRRRQSRKLGRT